jgi:mRNA interferase RelE/StbE
VLYRIEVSNTSHQQIRRLPEQTQERINQAIAHLAENPRPLGVKKLTAREGYRIRVGDYRILYQIDDAAKLVIIYRIAARGDVYRF